MTHIPLQAAIERVGAVLNERTRKYVIAAGDGYIWRTLEIADLQALLDAAGELERLNRLFLDFDLTPIGESEPS